MVVLFVAVLVAVLVALRVILVLVVLVLATNQQRCVVRFLLHLERVVWLTLSLTSQH